MSDNEKDTEFEKYLGGGSYISKLYAASKTPSHSAPISEELTNSILDAADDSSNIVTFNGTIKQSTDNSNPASVLNKSIAPFALAASIVIAIIIVLIFPKTSSNLVESTPQVAKLERFSRPDAGSVASDNLLDGAMQDNQGSQKPDYPLKTQEKLLVLNTLVASGHQAEAAKSDKSTKVAVIYGQSQNASILAEGVQVLELNTTTEETIAVLADDVVDEDIEEDAPSYSWLDNLAVNRDVAHQFTTQTSSALSADEWIKAITLLHEQNRGAEVVQSLIEFRKNFPNYKIPQNLRDSYPKINQ